MTRPFPDPLPTIAVTPKAVNRTCLPLIVNVTSRHPGHPLNTEVYGRHDYMDEIFLQELSEESGAMIIDVEGMPSALFPDHAFPVPAEELLEAFVAMGFYDAKRKRWVIAPKFSVGSQEREMAKFFEKLRLKVEELFAKKGKSSPKEDERYWTAAYRDNVLPGGVTERKPDLVELLVREAKTWGFSISDLQLKASVKEFEAAAKQLHDGGLNTLSTQDDRIFHIGLGVVNSHCFLHRYDRSGCMRSVPFDINKDPVTFLKVLVGLSSLPLRFVGRDISITTRADGRYVTVAGVNYRILSRINENAGIRGLGTIIWRCDYKRKDGTRKEVFIKGDWVDTSRVHTEAKFLKMARDKQVRGVPRFIASEAVTRQGAPVSTEYFRNKVCSTKQLQQSSEFRVYTRTVMGGYGSPLGEFRSKAELLGGILGGVEAHLELVDKCGIIHGNIRDDNILLDNRSFYDHGFRRGMIAGITCPIVKGQTRTEASKGQKDSGAAFMAGEILLYPHLIAHEPRHDLESFVHVLIWTCALHEGPNNSVRADGFDITKTPLNKWLSTDLEIVGAAKDAVMMIRPEGRDPFRNFLDQVIHPYFDDFKEIIWDLREAIMRPSPVVTHQEVIVILRRHLDTLLANEGLPPLSLSGTADDPSLKGNTLDSLEELVDVAEPDWDLGVELEDHIAAVPHDPIEDALGLNGSTNPSDPSIVPPAAAIAGSPEQTAPAVQTHTQNGAESSRNARASRKSTNDHVTASETHAIYRHGCYVCGINVEENEEGAIECQGSDCGIRFFHRACIERDFEDVPEDKWTCKDCKRKQGQNKKKAKTQSNNLGPKKKGKGKKDKGGKRPSLKTVG
ncbi:hypothetical protein GGG16DRAFT_59661 [Schizophyllum commune]